MFKVGDIIIANPQNNFCQYGVTNAMYGFVGEVIRINTSGLIVVKTLESDIDYEIGEEYEVEPQYFLLQENEETRKLVEFLKSLAER